KNQAFLLEAFARLHREVPRAQLLLVGEGPDEAALRRQSEKLGLGDSVRFLGARNDVARLLMAMDVFALPSRFEGLSIAALEAQAAGLPCLLSDTLPRETCLTKQARYVPITNPAIWTTALRETLDQSPRVDQSAVVRQAGYDLANASEALAKRFTAMVHRAGGPHFRRRLILSVPSSESYTHALTKARVDVEKFAVSQGFLPFPMRAADSAHGSRIRQAQLLLRCTQDWLRLYLHLRRGDLVLMQYQHFPVKSAPLARRFIQALQKRRGVCFAALIHDLDSLRGISGAAAVYSDEKLLPVFDRIICHNPAMKRYLESKGIPADKMIPLRLFDYAAAVEPAERTLAPSVCIAGNLTPEKCGYLYELLQKPALPYTLHLYGVGFTGETPSYGVYHGVEPAEELPGKLEGTFGLVWDGEALDGCTGVYGEYTRLNNPHKLSLYLTAGMPVVVWAEAATAEFVQKQQVGLTIHSLSELDTLCKQVSPAQYAVMAQNARSISKRVQSGAYLAEALSVLEASAAREGAEQ
ncbi:MAG: glycosyltransferase, partial [Eubacteriales bacterium]|nr:glycosyltransferase [Eubacteriales bacterium]